MGLAGIATARTLLSVYFEIARQHGIREKELLEIYRQEYQKFIKNYDPKDLPDAKILKI